jgi:hypothetical protein
MKQEKISSLLLIFVFVSLLGCKAGYMTPEVKPDLHSFKIIQDKEMLIANVDSSYILDCLRDNPDILDKILSGEKTGKFLNQRKVIHREIELGKKLSQFVKYENSNFDYLVCAKPDGNVAIVRFLESNIEVDENWMRSIQHLAFNYQYEQNLHEQCLSCGKLIITLSFDERMKERMNSSR